MHKQTGRLIARLYPVYADNVRIGTVQATSLEQAIRKAKQTFSRSGLRILPPYIESQSWAWDVPCPTI